MTILRTEGLYKSFGGLVAVAGVELVIRRNTIHSIIGPNGAGKTTLFNLISGHLRCDRGRVFFKDRDVAGMAPEKIARMGMGRSFQVTNIFPGLTVFENIQATILFRNGEGFRFFVPAKPLAYEETNEILAMVEMADKRDELGGILSAGDRKRLELGIVLAAKPDLVLLDEPTCGMSPVETANTIELIQRIARDTSLTVLFTEHKMDVVFSISDHVTVMNFGSVIASGEPELIRNDAGVRNTYFGEE